MPGRYIHAATLQPSELRVQATPVRSLVRHPAPIPWSKLDGRATSLCPLVGDRCSGCKQPVADPLGTAVSRERPGGQGNSATGRCGFSHRSERAEVVLGPTARTMALEQCWKGAPWLSPQQATAFAVHGPQYMDWPLFSEPSLGLLYSPAGGSAVASAPCHPYPSLPRAASSAKVDQNPTNAGRGVPYGRPVAARVDAISGVGTEIG